MKKLLALALSILMLVSLIACANDSGQTPSGNDTTAPGDTTTAPGEESTVPPETEITPNLPDVGDKYKGTEVVFVSRGKDVVHYVEPWIYAEAINGDTINDAVYKRNAYIEEKYGVKITEITNDDVMSVVETAVNAQDDLYDAAYPKANQVSSRILKGMMYDLHDLTYLDFDKPWWDSNCYESTTYKGLYFFGVSDISLAMATSVRGMVFNRDLIRQYELEDPYQLVKDNQWTMAKMIELIQKGCDDLDGDQQMTDADLFGMLREMGGGNGNVSLFITSAGIPIFEMDNEGNIAVSCFTERTINVLELCRSFLNDKTVVRGYSDLTNTSEYDTSVNGRKWFSEGHCLFLQSNCRVTDELTMLNMEAEYGLVPNPKLDADQEEYQMRPDRNSSGLIIPITNQPDDLERLSIILEDMAYMSSKVVVPEYYETIINLRRARVPELGQMVDLIKNSIYYDISTIFTIDYHGAFDSAFTSGNFASTFSRYQRILENEVKKLTQSLEALG